MAQSSCTNVHTKIDTVMSSPRLHQEPPAQEHPSRSGAPLTQSLLILRSPPTCFETPVDLLPTPNRSTQLISTRPPISIMIYPNPNEVDSPVKDATSIRTYSLPDRTPCSATVSQDELIVDTPKNRSMS